MRTTSAAVGAVLAAVLLVIGPAPANAAPPGPAASPERDEDVAAMADRFAVTLTAEPRYRLGEPIALAFGLRNPSGQDYSVLAWHTPLDNPDQEVFDYLRVRHGDRELPYEGRRIKRGDPGPSAYRLVRAGETLRSTVDVSTSYAITEPGVYTVTLATRLGDVVSGPTPAARTTGEFTGVDLAEVSVTFEVVAGGPPRLPLSAGPADEPGEPEGRVDVAAAKDPKFSGGTAARKKQTKKAHQDAYKYAVASTNALPNPPPKPITQRYVTWFGAYDDARYATARSHFTKIRGHLENVVVTYYLEPPKCDPSTYAYVYPSDSTKLYLCSEFWKAPALGTNSKAGTVIHEMSHYNVNGGTQDYAYGQAACKALAKDKPAKAVMNADNHEYFAESISV
ncbi:M35 family metallo-endopeptidase [Saccharothrix australiensis]|uniref:Extracellular peptidase n=1 Tax=Saccharothrix australiensis TaxID=2072 RepID=A0A495W7H0_9PSEU|nr:M35 family metallo-endopeptidase [Saccharothrix australiensis]RKT56755.1 extracellular peptidase [Saccharothrix australiensis]